MGEIKSTIDLVLEKTKNLTLSSKEKQKLARKELEKKVQGLLKRYLDNLIPLRRLTEEMEKIADNEKGLVYTLLKKHLLAHLDLDSDNSSIFSALNEITGYDVTPLTNLQNEYQSEKERTKKVFIEKSLVTLQERGVSGSAVVPNLDKSPDWNRLLDSLCKRYQERLKTIENG